MSSNIDLIRSLYAAFDAGDVPAFLARLDPRVHWNEAESFPYADRNPYVGRDAIIGGVFQRLESDWGGFRVGKVVRFQQMVDTAGVARALAPRGTDA